MSKRNGRVIMSEYQLIELLLNVSTKQDALWAIFFSVHMAIFGGIIYVDRPLRAPEKLFAIAAYLVFALMNFVALRAGQRIIGALRSDLTALYESPEDTSQTASLFETSNRFVAILETLTIGIHVTAIMVVVATILLDRSSPSLGAKGRLHSRP